MKSSASGRRIRCRPPDASNDTDRLHLTATGGAKAAAMAEGAGAKLLPLLIHLHGAGERGNDIETLADRMPFRYFNGQATQPFIIVMPQCLADEGGKRRIWEVEDLDLLFAHLEKTVRFDANRVYLTGDSMGGYGTWAWAAGCPQHFAAIAPHAGAASRTRISPPGC